MCNKKKDASIGVEVEMSCFLEYLDERLTLKFYSNRLKFRPASVKVYFLKQSITEWNVRTKNYNICPNEVFTLSVSFSKIPIDFFGFSKDRIFTVGFTYYSSDGLKSATDYSATLPIVKQAELHFKPPGTTYPDVVTRSICQQGFKMNDGNSDDQIHRCILLEEFKLMPIVERYKAYGYVNMLVLFLDIENSFELDLLQKSNFQNASILQLSTIHYKINVSFSFYSTPS